MNKYQEALDYLAENSMYETVERSDLPDGVIWKEVTHKGIEAQDLLQELVDKATPKKPIKKLDDDFDYEFDDSYTHHYCPNCENEVEDTYCPHCGQALDWSE